MDGQLGRNGIYETPLYKACLNGNIHLVKYLVEHGADVNKENKNGETPLYISSKFRNKDRT